MDVILDKAGQKGTGKWTAQIALDLGIPIPTISAALDARALSSMKDERLVASAQYGRTPSRYPGNRDDLIASIHDALYASKICSYAQGMSLIAAGAREWNWKISLREMARIWKGGCIIRALLLDSIMQAFDRQPALPNLLLTPISRRAFPPRFRHGGNLVGIAASLGIPAPAFSASLAYFDAYTSAQLPQNLTQAQRDYFGAHTYQRADRPQAGFVHTGLERADFTEQPMTPVIEAEVEQKLKRPALPDGEPCTLVIFGASGDLTRRKLIPALYDLCGVGCMNARFEVVGTGRTHDDR